MNKLFSGKALAIGGAILAAALIGGPASAEQVQVVGKINNACRPEPGTFVVPAGKTATNFRILGLHSGNTCTTNQIIKTKGFQIQNANYANVYSGSANGPIGGFSLGPGTYRLYVDGGVGAGVTMYFDLN